MIVDGRAIASRLIQQLKNEVTHLTHKPHFTVFTCAPNFETRQYLQLKMKRAKEVGIGINVIELPETITTEEAVWSLEHACIQTDGVMVQLPLPEHLATEKLVAAIPPHMDVDGMQFDGSSDRPIHPVAGAIACIAEQHDVLLAGQQVVVVGQGQLVGKPVALWAKGQGARVITLTKDTKNNAEIIKSADILILGVGQPRLITPDMVQEGVIIFDAGTSELGGKLTGDADPACAEKAALFTPVPGGIGPVTVAVLLSNVARLV